MAGRCLASWGAKVKLFSRARQFLEYTLEKVLKARESRLLRDRFAAWRIRTRHSRRTLLTGAKIAHARTFNLLDKAWEAWSLPILERKDQKNALLETQFLTVHSDLADYQRQVADLEAFESDYQQQVTQLQDSESLATKNFEAAMQTNEQLTEMLESYKDELQKTRQYFKSELETIKDKHVKELLEKDDKIIERDKWLEQMGKELSMLQYEDKKAEAIDPANTFLKTPDKYEPGPSRTGASRIA